MKKESATIELWCDENRRLLHWDTEGKFTIILIEHGSILLEIDDCLVLCCAPSLLLINQNSKVTFKNSSLLKASRITPFAVRGKAALWAAAVGTAVMV